MQWWRVRFFIVHAVVVEIFLLPNFTVIITIVEFQVQITLERCVISVAFEYSFATILYHDQSRVLTESKAVVSIYSFESWKQILY